MKERGAKFLFENRRFILEAFRSSEGNVEKTWAALVQIVPNSNLKPKPPSSFKLYLPLLLALTEIPDEEHPKNTPAERIGMHRIFWTDAIFSNSSSLTRKEIEFLVKHRRSIAEAFRSSNGNPEKTWVTLCRALSLQGGTAPQKPPKYFDYILPLIKVAGEGSNHESVRDRQKLKRPTKKPSTSLGPEPTTHLPIKPPPGWTQIGDNVEREKTRLKRPLSITIICVLIFLPTFLEIAALASSNPFSIPRNILAFSMISILLNIYIIFGLWRMRRWAADLYLVLTAIYILLIVVGIPIALSTHTSSQLFRLGVNTFVWVIPRGVILLFLVKHRPNMHPW